MDFKFTFHFIGWIDMKLEKKKIIFFKVLVIWIWRYRHRPFMQMMNTCKTEYIIVSKAPS